MSCVTFKPVLIERSSIKLTLMKVYRSDYFENERSMSNFRSEPRYFFSIQIGIYANFTIAN